MTDSKLGPRRANACTVLGSAPWRRTAVAFAVASCFASPSHANPTGPNVVSGQATITQQGKQLNVVNSPGAVIQWQGFSIRADEATRFIQQSAASAVLNRVVGADPSAILGTLSSNGRVFIINPNGILFGQGAKVDVAGLVASSLDMSNTDFAAGRLKFGETPGAKAVENQGAIKTRAGGEVILVAPDVKNSGVITSPKGEVVLAAGKSVEIIDPKSPHLRVEITAPANEAVNLGTIVADGGRVSIYASAIRNAGRIQANTVERTKSGEIILRAKKDVVLEKQSVITANGEVAGKVTIQAESGTATVNGVVEAKALAREVASASVRPHASEEAVPAPATPILTVEQVRPASEGGSHRMSREVPVNARAEPPSRTNPPAHVDRAAGQGGEIRVLGETVAVVEAVLDASGPAGGGTVLIGGDLRGANAAIQNARVSYVGPNSTINVDAVEAGRGGRAVVWAEEATYFEAALTARGGSNGGDGGFVETSSKGALIVRRAPELSARRNGKGGTWLLDPFNLTVTAADLTVTDVDPGAAADFRGTASNSTVAAATIVGVLNGGNDVILDTTGAGADAGNITISGAIAKTAGTAATLTLKAHNNIAINAGISSTSGALNLVLTPDQDAAGGGSASIGAAVNLNGGTLTLPAGSTSVSSGVTIGSAYLGGPSATLTTAGTVTLDDVTIGSNLTASGNFDLVNGLTLANGVTFAAGSGQLLTRNTMTIGMQGGVGTASLTRSGGTFYVGYSANSTTTIGSGVTVSGSGNISAWSSGVTLSNAGTIDATGGTLTLSTATLTNQATGTIRVSGGTLNVNSTNWSGTGGFDVSAGSLNLGGSFATASLGVMTHSGGSVNITGTLNNGGATLDIGPGGQFGAQGLTALAAGTIVGGTLVTSGLPAQTLSASSTSTLDGVTIGSNLTASGNFDLVNGLTLVNGVTFAAGSGQLLTRNTMTIGMQGGVGTASLTRSGGTFYVGYSANSTTTIGSGVTVSGSGNISAWSSGVTLSNAGTIDATGGTLTLSTATLTNQATGTIRVSGGTLNVNSTNWSGTGGFDVSAGSLNLGGSFATASLGVMTHSGGSVNITGTLNNGGATLDIGPGGQFGAQGLTALAAGTIVGGTLVTSGLPAQTLSASSTSTLDGVTIGSNLTASGNFDLVNGLTLVNGVTFAAGSGQLLTRNTMTIGMQGGVGTASLTRSGGTFYVGYSANSTTTIGSGVTVSGSGNISAWSSGVTLSNAGTIDATGGTLTLSTATLTNQATGTIRVSGGTLNVNSTNWSGTGGFDVSAGSLNLGGSFATASLGVMTHSGGSVNITGTLNNGGATLDIGPGGQFGAQGLTALAAGTIVGGTLVTSGLPAQTLSASSTSTLDGVTIGSNLTASGNFDLVNGLTLVNGVTFAAGSGQLLTRNTMTIGMQGGVGTASLTRSGGTFYVGYSANSTTTIGSGVTVSGSGNISAWSSGVTLSNAGTIDATGGTLTLSTATLTNQATGTIRVSGGTLNLSPTTWSNAGSIEMTSGALALSGAFALSDIVGHFTRTGGTLTLPGTLDLQSGMVDIGDGGTFGTGGLGTFSGTIKNGTLVASGGAALVTSNGTLQDVTLGSSLTTSGGNLYVNNALTLADLTTLSLGSTLLRLNTNGASINTPGAATVQMASGYVYQGVSGTGTIGAGVTVQGVGNITGISGSSIVNNGVIDANAVGLITINPSTFTNAGTVRASTGTINVSPTSFNSSGALQVTGGSMTIAPTNAWSNGAGSSIAVSSGAISLGSTISLAGLLTSGGTFSHTGGALNLSGTMDLGGTIVDISDGGTFGTGGLGTLSGTLRNGTLITTGPAVLTSSSGVLDNITLGNSMSTSGSNLYVNNTLTLADATTLSVGSTLLRLNTNGASIVTPGSAAIQMASGYVYQSVGGTGTIGAGVTVQGVGNVSGVFGSTIVNNGVIDANGAGTITINPSTFTNAGTVRASTGTISITPTAFNSGGALQVTGGTMTIAPTNAWSNGAGSSITESSGTLTLGSTISRAGLLASGGAYTRTGGSLIVNATMDLGGATVDIGSGGTFGIGGLTTLSGTFANGTLVTSGGTVLTTSSGVLDNITLGNSMSTSGSNLYVANTLTLADTATLSLGSTLLRLNANGASVVTPGSATIQLGSGYVYQNVSGTGTIGTGVTVQGVGNVSGVFGSTIVNNGVIDANGAGTITINPSTFTNAGTVRASTGTISFTPTALTSVGTLEVTGGTMTIAPTNAWSNGAGSSITESSGTLTLGSTISLAGLLTSGGAYSRTGGSLIVNATMDLGGTTVDIGSGGTFGIGGLTTLSGTLSNGTLVTSGGTVLTTSNGVLSNITLGNSMSTSGSNLYVANTLTLADTTTLSLGSTLLRLNANGASVSTPGSATIQLGSGYVYQNVSGTGTIGTGVTVQGVGNVSGVAGSTIVNNGTIDSNSGGTITINPTTFTNNGVVSVQNNGVLNIPGGFTNPVGGIVRGSGTLSVGAGNTFTNNGSLRPGASPGFLTITGNLVLGATSNTDFEINGLARGANPGYDTIHATGTVTINAGATATLLYQDGLLTKLPTALDVGDTLIGITAGSGSISGSFIVVPPVGAGGPEAFVGQAAGNTYFFQRGTVFSGVNVWNSDSGGNWNDTTKWSAGSVPIAGQVVIVDRGPNANPTISVTDAQVSGRLQAAEAIAISGAANWTISGGDAAALGSLSMTGGTIAGGGNLAIGGAFTWSGGTISGTGSLALNGTTTISGIVDTQRATTNAGTVDMTGASRLHISNGAVFTNAGAFNLTAGHTDPLPLSVTSGAGTFNNVGTLTKASTVNQGFNSAVTFNNAGQVVQNAGTGTLTLSGSGTDTGDYTVNTGATLQLGAARSFGASTDVGGAGTVQFTAGTTTVGGTYSIAATGTTSITNGTAVFNTGSPVSFAVPLTMSAGALQGADDVTMNGFTWSGGTISGTGSLALNGTTTISGIVDTQRATTNAGTVDMTGASRLHISNGAVFTNAGAFNLTAGHTDPLPLSVTSGAGTFNNVGTLTKASTVNQGFNSAVTFNNAGQVVQNAGTGTLTLSGSGTDTGDYTVNTGATLQLGAARSFGASTDVGGAGTVQFTAGTTTVGGTYSIAATGTTSITNGTAVFNTGSPVSFAVPLTMSAGALQGADDVTMNGFTWSGGTISGTGSLALNGTTTISGIVDTQRATTNAGTVDMTGASRLHISNGAVFTNAGAFNLTAGHTDPLPLSVTSGAGTFNNVGTLTKASTVNQGFNSAVTFNNAGQVVQNAGTGTLTLSGSGADTGDYTVNTGATLQLGAARSFGASTDVGGAGTVQFTAGTTTVGGTYSIAATGTTSITNGTAVFNTGSPVSFAVPLAMSAGALQGADDVTMNGFTWSGGTISGTGSLALNGTTTISGIVDTQRATTNAGTLNMTGASRLHISNGAVFANAGAFNLTAGHTDPLPLSVTSGAGTFNNVGTLTKASTVNQGFNSAVTFNNAGQLLLAPNTGTLTVSGPMTQSGTIELDVGTILATGGNGLTNAAGGIVGGVGQLSLGTATLINAGTLRPGAAAGTTTGTLTITGNVTQTATGSVDLEIGPTATDLDVLSVSGIHTMTGGTLNVAALGLFNGPLTNAALLLYGSNAGTTLTAGTSVSGLSFAYGANSMTATFGALGTNFWNIDDHGYWDVAPNWSLGHAPLASEDAVIDRSAGLFTITIRYAQQAKSVSSNENFALAGGSLDVAQPSSWNSLLNVAGGTLTGAGSKTIHTLDLSGGAITGTGAVTVTNAFSQSGGTINIGAALNVTQAAGNLIFANNVTATAIDARALSGTFSLTAPLVATTDVTLGGTSLALASTLQAGGTVTLDANGGGSTQSLGAIGATGLRTLGSGTFTLNQASNDVASLAANLSNGSLAYQDANAVTIGSVAATSGIALAQTPGSSATIAAAGDITIAQPIGAAAVTLSTPANIVSTMGGGTQIDVSGANGTITLTALTVGTSAGNRIGVNPGAGSVAITAQGDVFVEHTLGDLIADAHYTISNAAVGGTVRLSTTDGRIEFGPSGSFAANTADDTLFVVANGTNGHIDHNGSVNWATNTAPLSYSGSGAFRVLNGTTYFNGPTTIAMPTQVAAGATLDFNAASSLQGLSLAGTLTGAGAVTVAGSSDWTAGTMSGGGTKTFTGTFALSGPAAKVASGTTLALNGTTNWSGGGAIDVVGSNISIGPGANFNVNADGRFFDATSGGGTIAHLGTLTKTAGSGVAEQFGSGAALNFNNAGIVAVQSGTLQLAGASHGGTFATTAGAAFNFHGGVNALNDGVQLNGTGTFGFVPGAGGSVAIAGSGTGVALGTGATFALNGFALGGTGTLNVHGMLVSSGSSSIQGPVVNSGGTIDVTAGTLTLSSAYAQTGSTTQVGTGATLVVPAGMSVSAGELSGTGTVLGNVVNTGGHVQPGGAGTVGTLTVQGNYTQGSAGVLAIDIAGTGPAQADFLQVTGTATLDGSLVASPVGAYAASSGLGDTVAALAASTRIGAFANASGGFAQPVTALYSPADVKVTLAPAGVNAWAVNTDGNWSDPNNWNLGRVPQSGDSVVIDRPGGPLNITVSAGAQSAASVVARENMTLSGGSLDVALPSAWTGTLTINGGTLTGAGDKLIATLDLVAGSISGSGSVDVTSGFAQTGGTVAIGGALRIHQAASDLVISAPLSADSMVLATPGTLQIAAPLTAASTISVGSGAETQVSANVTTGGPFVAVAGAPFRVDNAALTASSFELVFPALASGGLFVNGVEDAVTSGNGGFFVSGSAAVLGTSLFVTYGTHGLPLLATLLQTAVDQTTRSFDVVADKVRQATSARKDEEPLATEEEERNQRRRRPQQCS